MLINMKKKEQKLYNKLSRRKKKEIEKSVHKFVKEYRETLKMLSKN